MYKTIIINKLDTSDTWNLAASFTPIVFNKMKKIQTRIEEINTGNPVMIKIISDIPNMAKALFNDNANQLKKPEIVPINGPKLLLIK